MHNNVSVTGVLPEPYCGSLQHSLDPTPGLTEDHPGESNRPLKKSVCGL